MKKEMVRKRRWRSDKKREQAKKTEKKR